jgi:hypothetical protein
MRKSFEVTKLDKGYDITVYLDEDKEIYTEPKRGVAATKAEVKEYFNVWIDNDGSNFSFGTEE